MEVGVIGAGVTGLGTALELSKAGHRITIIERDQTPMPESSETAFLWDRSGAPQVRHSHALLGRLHNLLRDNHPEVLNKLIDVGATEICLTDHMPETLDDHSLIEEDKDLFMLAARRTTFEWVLRNAVMENPDVEIQTGKGVQGLTIEEATIPRVTGVQFDDSSSQEFDCVIAANGRRSTAPEWLKDVGISIPQEEVEDTGIIYYSRFYQLPSGVSLPVGDRLVAGDLGYLKYGVFWGDNGTFSITFATSDSDKTFWGIRDSEMFEDVVRLIPAAAPWLELNAEPITEVHSMAGLLNRKRTLRDSNGMIVNGFHLIGDALICTNPLYGRGCSTGFWQAHLLGQTFKEHPDDLDSQGEHFAMSVEKNILPWYIASVESDKSSRSAATSETDNEIALLKRSILKEGLMPATQTSSTVWRAFMRMMNLLTDPKILSQPEISSEIMKTWETRDQRAPDPPLGPSREEMLEILQLSENA